MNVRIQIAGETRPLSDAEPEWITQQVNRRRAEGQSVCVRVTIEDGPVHLTLSTPGCAAGVGSRSPSPEEQRFVDLWLKHHLNETMFTGGNVVSFLRQLDK